jgi:putative transposase
MALQFGGGHMSLNALRRGAHVTIGPARFLILKKLDANSWQLENTATGEWGRFTEENLLDRFARHELTFDCNIEDGQASHGDATSQLDRSLSVYPPELVRIVQGRVQYLKEIDRQQPIAITSKTMEPLIRSVSERINDTKPPGWRTLSRDYRKWLSAGRDVRAVMLRYSDRGSRAPRLLPEVKTVIDEVIDDLYMTAERKRVPEIHLEIVRRLADANQFRPANALLPIPSQRAIYREIERKSPYELMIARYGKRRAEMEFRVSGIGPETSRALQRVSMDHTPSDIIVVDDNTMLPLGRPTITSALDEHTRCPMGFYTSFEPPSCLSVMRCLKHAILPKTLCPARVSFRQELVGMLWRAGARGGR